MKKRMFYGIVMCSVLMLSLTSCSRGKKMIMSDDVEVVTARMYNWSRPNEIGYEILGDVEATYSYSRIFGFPVGEIPETSIIFGLDPANTDPILRFAASKAVRNGDGLMVTKSSVTTTGLWPMFFTKTARVKGKEIKLQDLGRVSQDRIEFERHQNTLKVLERR